jgi:hypothetical protein
MKLIRVGVDPDLNAEILAIAPISDHAQPGRLAEGLIDER